MHHYERALAVVNFVVGSTAEDQAEVQHNKATVLLNMAAVRIALQVRCRGAGCTHVGLRVAQVHSQHPSEATLL